MLENIERTWSRHCYGQGHCVTPWSNIAVLATNVIKMTEWPVGSQSRQLLHRLGLGPDRSTTSCPARHFLITDNYIPITGKNAVGDDRRRALANQSDSGSTAILNSALTHGPKGKPTGPADPRRSAASSNVPSFPSLLRRALARARPKLPRGPAMRSINSVTNRQPKRNAPLGNGD